MSRHGSNLSEDIKTNLREKISFYVNLISEEDRQSKTIIFTDDVNLWKDNVNTIINVNLPLPPIPDDYDGPTPGPGGFDILADMLKFVSFNMQPYEEHRETHFYIHNNGTEARPKAHLIFSQINIEDCETLLRTEQRGHLTRWHHSSSQSTENGRSHSESTESSNIHYPTSSLSSDSPPHGSRSEGGHGTMSRSDTTCSSMTWSSMEEGAGQAGGDTTPTRQEGIEAGEGAGQASGDTTPTRQEGSEADDNASTE